jgi:hypothetical protein
LLFSEEAPAAGLDRINGELREVYAAAGAPEAWRFSCHATGPMETAAMRAEILAFLQQWM